MAEIIVKLNKSVNGTVKTLMPYTSASAVKYDATHTVYNVIADLVSRVSALEGGGTITSRVSSLESTVNSNAGGTGLMDRVDDLETQVTGAVTETTGQSILSVLDDINNI